MRLVQNASIVLLVPLLAGFIVYACEYDKNPCEQSFEIQKEEFEGYPECPMCKCVNDGRFCRMDWQVVQFRNIAGILIPDYEGPGFECITPEDCDEGFKESAERCIEDEKYCYDWMYREELELNFCEPGMLESFGFTNISCGR